MTTTGKSWQCAGSVGDVMRTLVREIAEHEAMGHPVIVELEAPVPEHVQRLYASLGVLVRFI